MRTPEELHHVPWHELTHAYGSAEDVPDQIRALYAADEEAADEALYELFGNIHHQGTVYEASAPAVPFLAHAATHVPPARRAESLMLLAVLADHAGADLTSPHWPGSPVAAVCAQLVRELPGLLPCLRDGERRDVRRAALRVVAAVADLLPAELREAAAAEADTLYARDPAAAVRADAMVVRAMLGGEPAPLDSPEAEVRLASALLAAQRSGAPYAPEVVDVLAEAGADPDPGGDDFPWPGTDTQDALLTTLLSQDPDAGLTVAARWIAAGDIGTRGSWLAEQIVDDWRDREPAFLDLMLAALPRHREPAARANRLRAVARWIALHPAPGRELRDTLHAYARGAEPLTAKPALLALVRARDERALELLPDRPDPRTLRAAPVYFPAAAATLVPVLRRCLAAGATGNDAIALVEALAAIGPAAIREAQPELIAALRSERAAIVAARRLGAATRSPETEALLVTSMSHRDASVRAASAVAHHEMTGDPAPALAVFEALLSSPGESHWHLSRLCDLGPAALPLLPLVEPHLTAGHEWARVSAAEAVLSLTGSPSRTVPILVEAVSPTPVGLHALKSLAALGPVPEELRPTLEAFAASPTRLMGPSPTEELHPDVQLRALARELLAPTA